jgi:4-amino-4-deoxy-L-arabinose transferase-like glycosyltransferase
VSSLRQPRARRRAVADDRTVADDRGGLPGPVLVARVALVAALVAFAGYAAALLLHDPVVWPDEALFADPAIHLLRRGHLGTELMAPYLPGIAARTYWVPPLYFVVLAAVFAVAGVGVAAMRALSVAAAAGALAATWALGRRAGLDRAAACVPVALLAVDGVFLRGARLGRMDMLALALTLAACERALALRTSARRRDGVLAGLCAGLAVVTHPFGAVAPAALALSLAWTPPAERRRDLGWLLTGLVGPLAAWGAYILRDPASFAAQFGAQLARKSGRHPWSVDFLARSLAFNLDQYRDAADPPGVDPHVAAGWLWGLGTAALAWAARRHAPVRLLLAVHLLSGLLALVSMEMWYPLFVLPTAALGVGVLFADGLVALPARRGALAALAALCVLFAGRNLARQEALRVRWTDPGAAADYDAWCARVGALLPRGATVFVSVFPDAYLGLARRTDLRFRSFVPEGLPVAPGAVQRGFAEATYVVVGPSSPGTIADVLAPRRGTLVGVVGDDPQGYRAAVYRMPTEAAP